MKKPQTLFRLFVATAFVFTGIAHLDRPDFFMRMVPPGFPFPRALVLISGVCEMTGALGLLIPRLRRPAAWGLIALLVAVFPANVYMTVEPDRFKDLNMPTWFWWLRLPMQPLFIAAVWWVGLRKTTKHPVLS